MLQILSHPSLRSPGWCIVLRLSFVRKVFIESKCSRGTWYTCYLVGRRRGSTKPRYSSRCFKHRMATLCFSELYAGCSLSISTISCHSTYSCPAQICNILVVESSRDQCHRCSFSSHLIVRVENQGARVLLYVYRLTSSYWRENSTSPLTPTSFI